MITPLSPTPSCVTYGDHLQPQRQLRLENRVGVNIGMCGVAGGFSGAPRCSALARVHFGLTLLYFTLLDRGGH